MCVWRILRIFILLLGINYKVISDWGACCCAFKQLSYYWSGRLFVVVCRAFPFPCSILMLLHSFRPMSRYVQDLTVECICGTLKHPQPHAPGSKFQSTINLCLGCISCLACRHLYCLIYFSSSYLFSTFLHCLCSGYCFNMFQWQGTLQ